MRSLIAPAALCALVGCVTYVEAPPPDPVRALADPVRLESVATVDKHEDYESVRFRLHVRAPRDSTIALVLTPEHARGFDSTTARPVIEFGVGRRSAYDVFVQRQPHLRLESRSDTTGVLYVGHEHRDTTVTVLADVGTNWPESFTLRVNWYRMPRGDSLATRVLESREREAHLEGVIFPLNLAVAVAGIVTFFVVTTK